MATWTADGRLELSSDEYGALLNEMSALHQRVYGSELGCFAGSSEDLLAAVQDLRGKAAQRQDREVE